MNKSLARKSEFLSSEILENNFVKCFAPVHMTQYILGSSRSTVQYNFATPTTIGQRIYTILWVLAVTASLYFFESHFHNLYYDKNISLYMTYSVGIFVQYTSYILNILHVRFLRQEDIVRLYIKIQKIDHLLKLNNIRNLNIVQKYMNIFFVIVISSSFTIGYVLYIYHEIVKPSFTLCIFLGILTIYLELLIMACFIYYLGVRVKFINVVVQHHINKTDEEKTHNSVECFLLFITTLHLPRDYDYRLVEMKTASICLKLVVRIFKFVSDIYSFQVLIIITTIFIWTFLVLVAMFVGLRSKLISEHAAVLLVTWVVFYFSQVATLSVVSDWFVNQLNKTKSLCVNILVGNYSEPMIQAAEDMLNILNMEEPKFSVYGIFILNKGLSLQLLGLIANYVIILIQFNLL